MRGFGRSALAVIGGTALLAAALGVVAVSRANADTAATFAATLTGAQEVPPNSSPAVGVALVQIEGTRITYQVNVSNTANIVAAHIHLGQPGVAGPIVLTLQTPTPLKGAFTGTLAFATVINPPLEGPLAGQPISALLDQIAAGNAYVNVHTNDAIPPANTGPGDFPGGEVRGQLGPAAAGTPPPAGGPIPPTVDSGALRPGAERGRGR